MHALSSLLVQSPLWPLAIVVMFFALMVDGGTNERDAAPSRWDGRGTAPSIPSTANTDAVGACPIGVAAAPHSPSNLGRSFVESPVPRDILIRVGLMSVAGVALSLIWVVAGGHRDHVTVAVFWLLLGTGSIGPLMSDGPSSHLGYRSDRGRCRHLLDCESATISTGHVVGCHVRRVVPRAATAFIG